MDYLGAEPFVGAAWLHTYFTLPSAAWSRVDARIAARLPLAAWQAWSAAVRQANPGMATEGDLGGIAVLHPTGKDGVTWKPHAHLVAPARAVDDSGVGNLSVRVDLGVLRAEWTRRVAALLGDPAPDRAFYVRVRVYTSSRRKAQLLSRELRGFPGWRTVADERLKRHRAGRHLLSLRSFGFFSGRKWSATRKLLSIAEAPAKRGPICRAECWDEASSRPVFCAAPMVPLVVMPWHVQVVFASVPGSPVEPEERARIEHRHRLNAVCNCPGCVEIDGFIVEWGARRGRSAEPLRRAIGYLSALALMCSARVVWSDDLSAVAPVLREVLAEYLADEWDLAYPTLPSGFRPPGAQTIPPWRLRELCAQLECLIAQLDAAGIVLGDRSLPYGRRASWSGSPWFLVEMLWPRTQADAHASAEDTR